MRLTYYWREPRCVEAELLERRRIHLKVENMEEYRLADSPDKPLFQHPWREWRGVDIHYKINGLPNTGSRGKTVWYVPARTAQLSDALQIRYGYALKIVKHRVHSTFVDEYKRLQRECAIQNALADRGYSTHAAGPVLVVNEEENWVRWFEHVVHHPSNSAYLATIVEDVPFAPLPLEIEMTADCMLGGSPIDDLRAVCREANIVPYDICLGNVLGSPTGIKVVDVHKWTFI